MCKRVLTAVIVLVGAFASIASARTPEEDVNDLDVAELVPLAERGPADARASALHALGGRGEWAAVAQPAIFRALDVTEDAVRAAAAEALGRLGLRVRHTGRQLEPLLDDVSPEVLRAACDAFGRLRDAGPVARLSRAKDPLVRQAAMESLGDLGRHLDRNTTRRIVHVMRKDDDDAVRLAAAWALRSSKEQAIAVAGLEHALRDPSRDVKLTAANALAWHRSKAVAALPGLLRAMEDDDVWSAHRATWAIGFVGPEAKKAVPTLIDRLSHEDEDLRAAAAESLGRIGDDARNAVPGLRSCLDDASLEVRLETLKALRTIDPKNAPGPETVFAPVFEEGDSASRWRALWALDEFDRELSERTIRALALCLTDPSESVRQASVQRLGRPGPYSALAVDDLVLRLEDEVEEVREAAADALGAVGSQDEAVVEALARALEDPDEVNRVAVCRALGNAGAAATRICSALEKVAKGDAFEDVRREAEAALEAIRQDGG